MRLRTLLPAPPGCASLLVLLLLVPFAFPPAILAGQTSLDTLNPHAGHGAQHTDHRHHHQVPAGVRRSRNHYSTPSVTLLDQNGQPVPLRELLDGDRPVMLNFIFTSCTAICPTMSATFAGVQTRLGDDAEKVRMVSISIDPEYDTPAAL
ncbi:MAG: SCO family protein, partial [Gammaproteobacteria bacterium]